MAAPSFSSTRAGYRNLWDKLVVNANDVSRTRKRAESILADRWRYQIVEEATGVPWFVIAVIHYRESTNDFAGVLHNGQKIIGTGRKTTLVPKGRGPFSAWEEAAIDALRFTGLDEIGEWPVERIGYELEGYNGWGYFGRINSPYLWAGSNLYTKGKYVRDGVFDRSHVDKQLGTMTLLKQLVAMDKEIAARIEGEAPPPEPPPPLPPPPEPGGDDLPALIARVKAVSGAKSVLLEW